METLMKQIRVKLTGAEEENKADLGGSGDQKLPIQKTPSFKDKKKVQNWFQRQFSRKMSHDYDSMEMEHATAIAAAAFAIYSQEVSEIPQQKKIREQSFTKTKSKVDDTKSPISQFGSTSKWISGSFKGTNDQGKASEDIKKPERTINPAPSRKRSSTFTERLKSTDEIQPEPPSLPKRTTSFGDKDNDVIKPETPRPKVPPSVHQPVSLRSQPPPPPPPPPPPSPPPARQPSNLPRLGTRERKADAWEREELERIKDRYEKLLETIDSWEKRNKMKARRKLNKHEQSGDERKRKKAVRKYEEKMMYIDEIVGGARAQAEEKRRNEVLKSKEKANTIRATGKLPGPCSCF
ncbi:hypothetical protein RJT34_02601 [Clitoria ternatea]|uniref:Remorin C-terminal domain-containing protein n=1 Tax=Clitoria ternatea TaxID=43366 RepID=A0AAN9KKP1_CLITE